MDEDLKLPDDISAALKKLDEGAAKRAESVDPARVAERVLARLKDEPSVTVIRPRRWNLVGLRIAAALAVLVIGGAVTMRFVMPPHTGTSVIATDLGPDSATVIAAVEEARAAADGSLPVTTVTVEDLNVQELEALLQAMDNQENSL
jgi:hypothetical protein